MAALQYLGAVRVLRLPQVERGANRIYFYFLSETKWDPFHVPVVEPPLPSGDLSGVPYTGGLLSGVVKTRPDWSF